ncbi:MAG TPA: DoxX family protein, partial [Longimicrobiales bacterium]
VLNPSFVVEASRGLGYAPAVMRPIGIAELLCVLAYAFPRTAVLGAVLLTGYLGGATASKVRLGDPSFLFPVVIAVLLWGGLYLRDERLRALLPFTTKGRH